MITVPLERGLPANQAARSLRPTASSFIASKLAPTVHRLSVGARLARESGASVLQAYRVIVHREQARSYSSPLVRWSEACPRIRRLGPSGLPRHRSSRASSLLQLGAYPVGAVLARDMGGAVFQARRVIVHRGQARSHSSPVARWSGACPRIRRRGLSGLPRHRSSRASALLQLAGCPLERGLPANQAPRSFRPTASSFIASKRAPTARRLSVGARLARESGASVLQAFRVHNQPQSRHFTDAPQTAPQTVPLPDRYPGRRYGLAG